MKSAQYVPERGDLVWTNFTPQAGREQAGRRPALVITSRDYNAKIGLAVCCPVTSKVKQYPFEVVLPSSGSINGAVLTDHLRSLDWKERGVEFVVKAPSGVMEDVSNKLGALLHIGGN